MKPTKNNPGFIVKMKDGSRYFIPVTDRMIKDEMCRRLEEDRLDAEKLSDKALQRLCNQSKKYMSVDFYEGYVDEVFAGTEWNEWSSDAIRLPDEPISPDVLWEDAELSPHNHVEIPNESRFWVALSPDDYPPEKTALMLLAGERVVFGYWSDEKEGDGIQWWEIEKGVSPEGLWDDSKVVTMWNPSQWAHLPFGVTPASSTPPTSH